MTVTVSNPSIVDLSRALEAVFQRVMGNFGTGQLLVKTAVDPVSGLPGPDVVLPRGAFAIPVLDGGEVENAIVYVKRNPATYIEPAKGLGGSGGDWTITAAGTLVDVETLQGGEQVNQVAGVRYRWDAPRPGIEATSVLQTDVTGGDFASNRVKLVRQLRTMKSADQVALITGKVSSYPALVLGWGGMSPTDGPMQTKPGPRTARANQVSMLYRITWKLFVLSSTLESDTRRLRQGMTLVSDLLEILADCESARELRVSTSPGIEILNAQPFETNPRVNVDTIEFATSTALQRRVQPEVFSPWLTSHFTNEMGDQNRAPAIKMPDQKTGIPDDGV
jgi:hypothetical protein